MRHLRALVIPVLVLTAAIVVTAQQIAPGFTPLQGRWVVTGGEHNGKPLDAVKGGVMTVTGEAFEVRTASGNMLKGTLRVDPAQTPAHMDLLHADGETWEAIYEVSGDAFRLNYVEAGGKDKRPTAFTTSAATEESIITMRREAR